MAPKASDNLMYTITIHPKALPNDIVRVNNYRRKGMHEDAIVKSVSCGLNTKGVPHFSYRVGLLRTKPHARWKDQTTYLFITVGDDAIFRYDDQTPPRDEEQLAIPVTRRFW